MAAPAARQGGASIAAAISSATARLGPAARDRLDAEALMAHTLGLNRARLIAAWKNPLRPGDWQRFWQLVLRREAGEPLAYLLGRIGFCGLTLEAGPAALVPRPETELLVEWAADRARARARSRALDVGTGCGAIAVALARQVPDLHVDATDISAPALSLAARNVAQNGVADRVRLHLADLLPPGDRRFDLVVANLPYVGDSDPDLDEDVRRYEPPEALFGGPDGLAAIRRLLARLGPRLAASADVGLEIGWRQGEAVVAAASRALPTGRVRCQQDLAGHDRFVTIEDIECAS